MLDNARPSAQLKEWIDRLAPVAAAARAALEGADTSRLAQRSGCEQDTEGNLCLRFFEQELSISPIDLTINKADSGEPASSFTESLILTYLAHANGTLPSGRWIGFRELPEALFYVDAFQGYSGGRLVRELAGGLEAFRTACQTLAGTQIELGDAGYAFPVLPRIRLALAYWDGDEDFAPQARVLFEDTAAHYMPTDGLAILGSQLVGRVLRVRQKP